MAEVEVHPAVYFASVVKVSTRTVQIGLPELGKNCFKIGMKNVSTGIQSRFKQLTDNAVSHSSNSSHHGIVTVKVKETRGDIAYGWYD